MLLENGKNPVLVVRSFRRPHSHAIGRRSSTQNWLRVAGSIVPWTINAAFYGFKGWPNLIFIITLEFTFYCLFKIEKPLKLQAYRLPDEFFFNTFKKIEHYIFLASETRLAMAIAAWGARVTHRPWHKYSGAGSGCCQVGGEVPVISLSDLQLFLLAFPLPCLWKAGREGHKWWSQDHGMLQPL